MGRWGRLLASSALLAGMAGACGGSPGGLGFQTIARGTHANVQLEKPSLYEVRTQSEWVEFWGRLFGGDPPPVDFEKQTVLAAVDEVQPTGGYTMSIVRVAPDEKTGRLLVEAVRIAPGEGCITTQAQTTPYHVIELPAPGLEPVLTVETTQEPCVD